MDGFFVPLMYCAIRLWLMPSRLPMAEAFSSGWERKMREMPCGSGLSYSKLSNETSSSSPYQWMPSSSISYWLRSASDALRRRRY